jgi:isocitrate/isopropylmalate dehydrogenase
VKEINMEELDERTVGLVRHMSGAFEDFAEFMAIKNNANPRILVAAVALTLTELSFKHSKPGQEEDAIETAINGIRVMHRDLMEEQQGDAMAEAEEARARGSVQ